MTELPGGEVVVYEASDGEVRLDVRLDRGQLLQKMQQFSVKAIGIRAQPVQNLHCFNPREGRRR